MNHCCSAILQFWHLIGICVHKHNVRVKCRWHLGVHFLRLGQLCFKGAINWFFSIIWALIVRSAHSELLCTSHPMIVHFLRDTFWRFNSFAWSFHLFDSNINLPSKSCGSVLFIYSPIDRAPRKECLVSPVNFLFGISLFLKALYFLAVESSESWQGSSFEL